MKTNNTHRPVDQRRKGAFMVLAFFCLVVCTSFVAFSVDLGYLNVSKVEMQNCVDAAALAAAQEISAAVQNAPAGTADVTAYARTQARLEAKNVAQLNGYYLDKDNDVTFGRRSYNAATDAFEITWNVTPANVVKVTARRDNDDLTAADSKLKLFFAGVAGDGYAKLKAEAVAFVESRDIVVVHDFSRSMNFDSYFNDEADDHLTDAAVEDNLEAVWDDLGLTLGTLTFTPTYMTQSDTDSGVTTSVTFKYDDLEVVTTGELDKVKVEYSGGSQSTFSSVSGTTASINGSDDIKKVWVTTVTTEEEEEEEEPAGEPETITHYGLTVTFAADRKSYSVTGTEQLVYVDSYFTAGGYQYNDMPSPYPYSTSINEGAVIDYVKIRSKVGGSYYWTTFNASAPASGGGGGGGGGTTTVELEQYFVDTNDKVREAFGVDSTSWPYASGSWDGFIDHCRTHSELTSRGYREMYGGMGMVNYILRYHSGYWQCDDIWKTRHYPFHAIKEGHELFCNFLNGLGFDDQLGMVSYDTHHRVETTLSSSDPNIAPADVVDISTDPISNNYTALNNIMKYKQANHYYSSTNMGGGLKRGTELLTAHKRAGARSTILLMTDGNTNTIDSGEDTSLPSGWDWDALLDYDGDGSGDYYTSSTNKRYCLRKAYEARELGYTVHTMAVGIDADRDLMEAISHLTNGHFINVPGGSSVSQMEAEVQAAFHKIASFVPPAKLLNDTN